MGIVRWWRSLVRKEARDEFTPANPQGARRLVYDGRTGLDSNVVMAPVMWIMRTFVEAKATVQRRDAQVWNTVEDHPAELLLEQPNEHYDGDALWMATVLSYVMNGNAYQLKIRNRFGEVVEQWYVPHWHITPQSPVDGSAFITHYNYSSARGQIPIAPRDIIHYRFGLDPDDTRVGISPLRPLLREIFTDDEAARFSETILKNMGVPGLVVSPKDQSVRMDDKQYNQLKAELRKAYGGASRGEPFLSNLPMETSQFGFDPNKLMLASLRDVSEERVCAALGLPAAVVGFGSGMQATKVGATMRELVKMAWVGCLSPMQKTLAKQATSQLLPEFVSQTRRFRIRFDTSDVSGFQEDDNQRTERVSKLVTSGILRVDRAQSMLGLEVDDTQQVYLRPSATTPVGPDAPTPAEGGGDDDEDLPPAIAGRMNGNGSRNGAGGDAEEEE